MDYVNSSVNSTQQTTELYAKKVLAGKVETVHLRLIEAMETVGYDIIEEEPNIIGRRGARGWGTSYCSADVLDYPMTLTIRLKSLSQTSTRATFDYLIKHPMLAKGDINVVLQEAETIASLSKMHSVERVCSVCETESTDDSKFCRRCGAPLTSEQMELELLRMMAETRAGKASIVYSSVGTVISSLVILLALILNYADLMKPKLFPLLLVLGGAGLLSSMIASFFGWNRLKRALEKPEKTTQRVPRHFPETAETGEFEELPPRQPVASITEGTTNLLDEEWANRPEKEKVPVSRSHRDTNEF